MLVPEAALLALWFTLGGHFLEVIFRNQLRQRLRHQASTVHFVARLVWWFAGGSLLYAGALATAATLAGRGPVPWPWWIGGLGFLALELAIHFLLHARGRPSVYDGRG